MHFQPPRNEMKCSGFLRLIPDPWLLQLRRYLHWIRWSQWSDSAKNLTSLSLKLSQFGNQEHHQHDLRIFCKYFSILEKIKSQPFNFSFSISSLIILWYYFVHRKIWEIKSSGSWSWCPASTRLLVTSQRPCLLQKQRCTPHQRRWWYWWSYSWWCS